jgi:drug/metabolite transporter (DMT)-like permease
LTSKFASEDHHGKAILYLLFGVAAGLSLDLCAKWLLASYSLPQFVFLRSIFGLLFFMMSARYYGGIGTLRTTRWRWHLLRTLLATGAMFGFFYGLARMPLVSTLTIAFTAPLFMTGLSAPFLGEHVGWRRWLAVIVGFVGVLIVLRPGQGMFTPAAIAIIASALCYAGLALTARKLATTESTFALAVYVVMGPFLVAGAMLPGNYTAPTPGGWFFFALAGLCSAFAWFGIIGGYRRAPPAMLAPFEYTALVGAAAAGYFIWDEVPDVWVVAGGLIIIGSGLFIVSRELGNIMTTRILRGTTAGAAAALARRFRRD